MNALIVYAHPEPQSFNAALRDAAADVLEKQGHAVEVSDLYAMDFKPVVDRRDFLTCHDAEHFNVSLEQRQALAHGGLAADIASELDRLQRADLLILQFPLWWFGMPAILKGWIDRVFVSGAVYGRSAMFERGKLLGKRALVCVTTGAPVQAFGPDALNGTILDLLAPLHRGVLAFTGMTVLPPYVAYHVPYAGAEGRAAMLLDYRAHLQGLDAMAPLPMPRLADHPALLEGGKRPRAQ
jgi:NAD(P)H dehydrogenase (quinone)